MRTITPSQKMLLVSLVSLVASGVFYALVHTAITQKEADFIEARDASMRATYAKENEDQAQGILTKTAGFRSGLSTYLVSYDDPLELLSFVDEQLPKIAGVSAGVLEGGITKEEPTDEKGKKTGNTYVRIALNVKGNWADLFHYLLLLEHMPYATTIDKVVLSQSDTGGEYTWEGDVFLAAATSE